jgi:hypothetical protein
MEYSKPKGEAITLELHILFSLTSFMGTPNSTKILYNTSLLTESYAVMKFMNS